MNLLCNTVENLTCNTKKIIYVSEFVRLDHLLEKVGGLNHIIRMLRNALRNILSNTFVIMLPRMITFVVSIKLGR